MIEKSLVAGIDWVYSQEQTFLTEIGPDELTAVGTFEKWSAKNLVAHVAEYRRNIGDFLLRLEKEGTESADYTPGEPIDARNKRLYEASHYLTLDQVREQSRASWLRVKEAVLKVGPDFLEEPKCSRLLWSKKTDPLWRQTAYGEAIYHPMAHLWSYHDKRGRAQRSAALRVSYEAKVKELGLT